MHVLPTPTLTVGVGSKACRAQACSMYITITTCQGKGFQEHGFSEHLARSNYIMKTEYQEKKEVACDPKQLLTVLLHNLHLCNDSLLACTPLLRQILPELFSKDTE